MVLTVEDLYHLLNRAVAMCFPQADRATFQAHLVSVMTSSKTLLQPYPIDHHALGSPLMKQRGEVCRSCFRNFVTTLGEHSQFYAPPPSNMAALHTKSLRLPPGEDTFTRQSKQTGSLFALQGTHATDPQAAADELSSASESDESDPYVAALETRGGQRDDAGRPFARGSGRRERERDQRPGRYSAAPYNGDRKRDRHSSPSRTADPRSRDVRPRRAVDQPAPAVPRDRSDPAPPLPDEAPAPDADPKVIRRYIISQRVCFSHARGMQCRRMVEQHHCPYLHTDTPIPFRTYPRDLSAKELAALGEFDENGLYAVEVLASLAAPPAARTVSGTGGDRA